MGGSGGFHETVLSSSILGREVTETGSLRCILLPDCAERIVKMKDMMGIEKRDQESCAACSNKDSRLRAVKGGRTADRGIVVLGWTWRLVANW